MGDWVGVDGKDGWGGGVEGRGCELIVSRFSIEVGVLSGDGWIVESTREEKRDEEEEAKEERKDSILGEMQSSINSF